jgi:hypothetical protein
MKVSNIKFDGNYLSWDHSDISGEEGRRTDGHDKANRRFLRLLELAKNSLVKFRTNFVEIRVHLTTYKPATVHASPELRDVT